MSYTADLTAAVAAYLAAGSVGTWKPNTPYIDSDPTPIVLQSMPGAPDSVLVIADYSISDEYADSDSVIGLQVTMRGDRDPRTVAALSDAVFDRLQGLQGLDFPGGRVVMAWRSSETPNGEDGNNRHIRSANYYLTVWRPSPHRN